MFFFQPFLSKVEGLTPLSEVKGEPSFISNCYASGCRIGPALNLIGGQA
jgi:hypothetical protein